MFKFFFINYQILKNKKIIYWQNEKKWILFKIFKITNYQIKLKNLNLKMEIIQ